MVYASRLMKCEICHYAKSRVEPIKFGGSRPRFTYRKDTMHLCYPCRQALIDLTLNGQIAFHQDPARDTTNSRFSFIVAAIKRKRFGSANAPIHLVKRWIKRHPKRAAGTNPRALGTNPRALKQHS
jgi:hypothetical protein